jgi:Lon protease-like protein
MPDRYTSRILELFLPLNIVVMCKYTSNEGKGMNGSERIPLFPLGLVLLPGMALPLHIFEERYKLMIGECLKSKQEFGIVYFDGKSVLRVGCSGVVKQVFHRYSDGRLDILTVGKRRFHIQELFEEKAYIEAGVVFFQDEQEESEESLKTLAHEGIKQLEKLIGLTGKKVNLDMLEDLDKEGLSFIIASMEGFTHEERQNFLEMASTRERLEKSTEVLQKIVERLKLTNEIKRIFGGWDLPEVTLL